MLINFDLFVFACVCIQAIPVTTRSKAWSLRPLACWNCGLESRLAEWMSVSCECCVRCQVDVSAMGRSLVQRSLTAKAKEKKLCIHTSDLLIRLQIFMVPKIYFVVSWATD
jgi:hypothetical protein